MELDTSETTVSSGATVTVDEESVSSGATATVDGATVDEESTLDEGSVIYGAWEAIKHCDSESTFIEFV